MRWFTASRGLAFASLAAAGALAVVLLQDHRERDEGMARREEAHALSATSARSDPALLPPTLPLATDSPRSEAAEARVPVPDAAIVSEAAIAIVDRSGVSVAGVRWVAFRDEHVLASGTTSGDGVARFRRGGSVAAPDAPLELAAHHPAFVLGSWTLPDEPMPPSVELVRGAVLAGRVNVDGAPPRKPVRLRIKLESIGEVTACLPDAVTAALFDNPAAATVLVADTALDGSFRLEGVPPDWRGWLYWSPEYRCGRPPGVGGLQSPCIALALDAPVEDLLLELRTLPAISGRVVGPSGEPIAMAEVSARATSGRAESPGTRSAADGTFDLRFEVALPARVEIGVADAESAGFARYTFEVPQSLRQWHTGDLAVRASRPLAVVVRNERREPVAGARVTRLREAPWVDPEVAWTEAEGKAHLRVDLDAARLRVEAPGYEPADVAVPAGVEEVEAVLKRLPRLVVELSPPDARLGIALEAMDPDGKVSPMPWTVEAREKLSFSFACDAGETLRGNPQGRYELTGIRPGIPVRVVAVDGFGLRLAASDVGPLEPGEERIVQIDVPAALRDFHARVVNAAGAGVPRAHVRVSDVDGRCSRGAKADAEGRFRMEGLTIERLKIEVTAGGYAPLRINEHRASDEELVLVPGRDVRVHVVDASGAAVTGAEARAGSDLWPLVDNAREGSGGVYTFVDTPQEAFDIHVAVACRRFKARVEPGVEDLRIDVPVLHACRIELAGELDLLASGTAFVELKSVGDTPRCRRDPDLAPGTTELVEQVFPGRYVATVKRRMPGRVLEQLSEPLEFEVDEGRAAAGLVVLRRALAWDSCARRWLGLRSRSLF